MAHGKNEKVRLIVAFGDISGFSDYCDAVSYDEKELYPFLDAFDDLMEKIEAETGYTFSDVGDGFLLTVDLSEGHNCGVAVKVLNCLWDIYSQMEKLMDSMPPPRPDGFRITGVVGYVIRKVKKDGKVVLRGKWLNQCHKMLAHARGVGIVIHDNLKQLMNDKQIKKNGFEFERLKIGNRLWFFKVRKRG